MKAWLLVVSLFMFTVPLQAKWVVVDAEVKQGMTHYFDPESVQKNEEIRKFWVLSSYEKQQKGGYHAVKSRYELDCKQHKARSITLLLYPDKKATEAVIGAHHEESEKWFEFSSQSIFKQIMGSVCVD